MKVFLSYGDARDQATALRLQALSAVNGLQTFVPPAYTRTESTTVLDEVSAAQLLASDVILAVVRYGLADACRHELNAGLFHNKPVIVMTESHWTPDLQRVAGLKVVTIDPQQPEVAEREIMTYLRQIQTEQTGRTALLALGTLALGLLVFAPES